MDAATEVLSLSIEPSNRPIMEWSNKGFKWIPLFCLLVLNEKVNAFSACQHPPQEIQISRGQKITVVYWVGQNALEDGGFQDEASTLPSTEIPEIVTTEAATSALEDNSTTPNDEPLPSSESALSTDKTTSIDDEAISTDSNLQTIDARHADVTTDALPVTSSEAPRVPSTTSEDNTLQEDLLKTTETDLSESPISGRNDTALDDDSYLSTATLAETTSAGTTLETSDATAAQSEVVNVQFIATSTESQNGDDESNLGVSSRQLDPEVNDGTEVQYWSTTVVPEEGEESSTTEALSEDPQITETLESTSFPVDGDSELSTTSLPEGLAGKSIDETTTSGLDSSTVVNDDDDRPNLGGQSGFGNDDDVAESENSTTILNGKSLETSTASAIGEDATNATADSIDDDALVVNSSESSSGSLLQVRASLVVEGTLSPLVPSTETNDNEDATAPTSTEGSSLLDDIGTTLKNLLWTSVSESDVTTVEVPKGRKSEGTEQDLEGSTLAPSDDEQQKSNESTIGPDIVFPNTTADPEILTIDPREPESDSGNSTDKETTGTGDQTNLSENATEVSTTELDDTEKVEGQTVQVGSSTPVDQDGTEPVTPDTGDDEDDEEGDAESIGPVAIDPFQELPEVLVPLDNLPVHPTEAAAEEFISDVDRTPEKEGPRIGSPVDDFDPLASADTTGPILIPLSDDDDVKTEDSTKPKKSPPVFLSLPLEDVQHNPLGPPPIFLRYPDRGDNSFLNRHGFSVHDSPEVYIGDLQPAASSAYEPVYRNLYPSDQAMVPPESPVHYVSVLRSPDGVLPIQSLRTTPSKRRRVLQSRIKRSINETNCEWIFKSAPGVPLLLTFKSFSTPETTDCEDHYISVERESNGFQSRWCGVSKDRAGHASFARSEIRLRLFSKGDGSFPTGFSVEVQALDLKLLRKYAEVRRIIKHH